jgi:hypothetical protein
MLLLHHRRLDAIVPLARPELTLAWTRYGKKELADGIESCLYACLMKVIESCVSQ